MWLPNSAAVYEGIGRHERSLGAVYNVRSVSDVTLNPLFVCTAKVCEREQAAMVRKSQTRFCQSPFVVLKLRDPVAEAEEEAPDAPPRVRALLLPSVRPYRAGGGAAGSGGGGGVVMSIAKTVAVGCKRLRTDGACASTGGHERKGHNAKGGTKEHTRMKGDFLSSSSSSSDDDDNGGEEDEAPGTDMSDEREVDS